MGIEVAAIMAFLAKALPFILVLGGIWAGASWSNSRHAKKELEAKLEGERRLREADKKVIDLEHRKQEKIEELHALSKELNGPFVHYVNRVLREIFKPKP